MEGPQCAGLCCAYFAIWQIPYIKGALQWYYMSKSIEYHSVSLYKRVDFCGSGGALSSLRNSPKSHHLGNLGLGLDTGCWVWKSWAFTRQGGSDTETWKCYLSCRPNQPDQLRYPHDKQARGNSISLLTHMMQGHFTVQHCEHKVWIYLFIRTVRMENSSSYYDDTINKKNLSWLVLDFYFHFISYL